MTSPLTRADVERLLAEAVSGPWNLVWWGNEHYPYPLSILADSDGQWVARDGTVSSPGNARLAAAAPDLARQLLASMEENEKMREALEPFAHYAGMWDELYADREELWRTGLCNPINVGHLRKARAALPSPPSPKG